MEKRIPIQRLYDMRGSNPFSDTDFVTADFQVRAFMDQNERLFMNILAAMGETVILIGP